MSLRQYKDLNGEMGDLRWWTMAAGKDGTKKASPQ